MASPLFYYAHSREIEPHKAPTHNYDKELVGADDLHLVSVVLGEAGRDTHSRRVFVLPTYHLSSTLPLPHLPFQAAQVIALRQDLADARTEIVVTQRRSEQHLRELKRAIQRERFASAGAPPAPLLLGTAAATAAASTAPGCAPVAGGPTQGCRNCRQVCWRSTVFATGKGRGRSRRE